jgi:copper(I)-binding protein
MQRLLIILIILIPFFVSALGVNNLQIRRAAGEGYPTTMYLDIENDSDQLDYLLGVEIVDHPESKAIINKTVIEQGIAKIVKIDRLIIPADSKIKLSPLGIYIVVSDLTRDQKDIRIKFIFKSAEVIHYQLLSLE